jgi:thiamine biosynthesis lipoprotein
MKKTKGVVATLLIALLATGGILLLVFLTRGRTGEGKASGYSSPTIFAMDTTLDINIQSRPEKDARADVAAAVALVKNIEAHTSMFRAGSDVAEVNRDAGVAPVKVHPDTMEMVKRSLQFSAMMDGAFDITVAPIVRLWGFYDQKYRVPSQVEIDRTLPLVGYKKVLVDEQAGTVMLAQRGMQIDLGGVAKGYAVGSMYRLLKNRGVKSAVINFGGSVGAIGLRADGKPWVVGIKDPRGDPGTLVGELSISDNFVNTSGDYERYFIRDGVRYCHLIDPRTGRQPRSTMSTTIVGPDATNDDILSKLFVVGAQQGLELLGRLPGYDAVFVDSEGRIIQSSGMSKYVISIKERI